MPINKDKSKFWEGVEIEGRLYGLYTLFVGNLVTLKDLNEPDTFEQINVTHNYEHIYFNEEVIFKPGIFNYIRQISPRIIVSLSFYNRNKISELPKDLIERCHIVMVFEEPAMLYLKRTDTIKVEAGPWWNYQTTKQSFHETVPEDYEEDQEW